MAKFNCHFTSKPLANLFLDWLVKYQYDFRREIHPGEDIVVVYCYSKVAETALVEWMNAHKAV